MRLGIKVIFLILGLILVALLMQGCVGAGEGCETPTSYTVDNGVILLDKEGTIPCDLCEERGFDKKIIVLESQYCGACQVARPKIKEVGEELGVEVLFLDLSEEADALTMNGFRVLPYYTPTMLVGCDVYVGAKSKEEYHRMISGFAS